jgi:hypothetical protein
MLAFDFSSPTVQLVNLDAVGQSRLCELPLEWPIVEAPEKHGSTKGQNTKKGFKTSLFCALDFRCFRVPFAFRPGRNKAVSPDPSGRVDP